MCQLEKILTTFLRVYGWRVARPSSCIRFLASSISEPVKYHRLVISGTSGRKKKPEMAMGSEMTVLQMKSHCHP